MINVDDAELMVREVAKNCAATVPRVGASEKSDAIYIHIQKPKEVSALWGVMEYWTVIVRVSNHWNDTMTEDRLAADHYINIYEASALAKGIDELREYLEAAQCKKTS